MRNNSENRLFPSYHRRDRATSQRRGRLPENGPTQTPEASPHLRLHRSNHRAARKFVSCSRIAAEPEHLGTAESVGFEPAKQSLLDECAANTAEPIAYVASYL